MDTSQGYGYLLGLADETAKRQIESLVSRDEIYARDLSILKDELVDDYPGNALYSVDRQAFETFFLSGPNNAERLCFGRALNGLSQKDRSSEKIDVNRIRGWDKRV